ncbi:S1/P1 nuclease [Caulobacter sp. CCH5-E12]|uniref:S1/P1 nuclease n=1 Tax=Caulobacter sp. CCH5-E12 TaxID=1768770 RepID=UPI000785B80F|nr:S1/P1 nuclease [Caulobacter sp. CCH5-E12]
MTFRVVLALACLVVVAEPTQAMAWGGSGHKVIAQIAQARLSPKAREAANALLAASDDGSGHDFVEASTWADEVRGQSAQMRALTATWHYANLDVAGPVVREACPQTPYERGLASGTGQGACLITKLDHFMKTLADPKLPARERGLALRYLIHLVGDGHQPLHMADSCGDRGGNAKLVETSSGEDMNLHSYWDTGVVRQLARNPTALAKTLNSRISKSQARRWASDNTATWFSQAHGLAVRYAYSGETSPCRVASVRRLTPQYEAEARRVAAEQLEKAGVRLAAVLNGLLG